MQLAVVLCGLTVSSQAFSGVEPIIQRETPRPYGYAIGDVIRHELTVQPGTKQTLDPRSVPSTGPVNRWLELRRVDFLERSEHRIRILLEYQVFYTPLTVKNLVLPGFTLSFQGPDAVASVEVPPWNFSVAPIHGLGVLDSAAETPVRADAWPVRPNTGMPMRRIAASLLTAVAALLCFAYVRGLIGIDPRGRPFRDARRTLRRLRGRPPGLEVLKEAFSAVHRAFDRSLGEPLFAERLPEFFAGNPQFAGLVEDIEGFFTASYGVFFGAADTNITAEPSAPDAATGRSNQHSIDAASPFGLDRLEALCLYCLRAERGYRVAGNAPRIVGPSGLSASTVLPSGHAPPKGEGNKAQLWNAGSRVRRP